MHRRENTRSNITDGRITVEVIHPPRIYQPIVLAPCHTKGSVSSLEETYSGVLLLRSVTSKRILQVHQTHSGSGVYGRRRGCPNLRGDWNAARSKGEQLNGCQGAWDRQHGLYCLCRHCNKVVANYVSTASEISGTPHSIMFEISISSEWNSALNVTNYGYSVH